MCTHPHVIWNPKDCVYQAVPCRVCMECRLDYTKTWAVRVMNEASCYNNNCFITLTYNDENRPGDLIKADLQKFFKRLRKHLSLPIRYFACGERGGQFGREHFHAIIFNWYPGDTYYDKYCQEYRSPTLEKLWPFGFSTVGDVSFNSARYVASYIVKQHRGKDKGYYEENGLHPEFVIMSNGIGKKFCENHKKQLRALGYLPSNGYKVPLPRYYEQKLFNEEERKERKNEKFNYLEKARKIFKESLKFDEYLQFANTFKERTGHVFKYGNWLGHKILEKRKAKEERLIQKVNAKRKD